jgi:hypothetical protein
LEIENKIRIEGMKKIFTGKKGIVLMIDLVIGMTISFIIIIMTLFFITQGSEVTFSEHQLSRVGADIVTIMDEQNLFESLDHDTIETEMEKLLPGSYVMLLRIEGDFSAGNGLIEVGSEIPQRGLIITGKKAILLDDNTYVSITYIVAGRNR